MADRSEALAVRGFAGLQRALADMDGKGEFGLDYELRKRLKAIGDKVAEAAPQYVTHKTGRHGDPAQPALEDSVKVSATRRSVSVYSTAIYGGAQNYGAGPKRGWDARGPHIKRANASRWMTRAAESQAPEVERQVEDLLDWLEREFEATT